MIDAFIIIARILQYPAYVHHVYAAHMVHVYYIHA